MGLLYGRAGRLTARFGGFRPGQMHDKYLSYMQTSRGKSCVYDAEEQIMAGFDEGLL